MVGDKTVRKTICLSARATLLHYADFFEHFGKASFPMTQSIFETQSAAAVKWNGPNEPFSLSLANFMLTWTKYGGEKSDRLLQFRLALTHFSKSQKVQGFSSSICVCWQKPVYRKLCKNHRVFCQVFKPFSLLQE